METGVRRCIRRRGTRRSWVGIRVASGVVARIVTVVNAAGESQKDNECRDNGAVHVFYPTVIASMDVTLRGDSVGIGASMGHPPHIPVTLDQSPVY